MRQKSDRKKLEEGRCLGEGREYVGFLKANEAKSIGTASEIWDPIEKRTVDVLSQSEKTLFWCLRYSDRVAEIREQMLMNASIVEEICRCRGFRIPTNILSTDFLVTHTDGTSVAYSVKADRDEFHRDSDRYRLHPNHYNKLLIRQSIECDYWKRNGTDFRIIFGSDLNKVYARNIEICMGWYDRCYVTDTESKLKYLLAHKWIDLPMDTEPLRFARLAQMMKDEIEEKDKEAGICRN